MTIPEPVYISLLALLAGAASPLGAILARADLAHPKLLTPSARHFIVAFGGGALVSAVALVLVPEGIQQLSVLLVAICFCVGGVFFYFLEVLLSKAKSSAGQLVAMLSDFIPEAIALGTAFAMGKKTGLLLALLMVLQNLPEGFNAYEELIQSEPQKSNDVKKTSWLTPNHIIAAFCGLAFLGPIAALFGYYVLANQHEAIAGLMLFASAGILYLVFQDIAPQSKIANSRIPALGAVMGFLLGLVGNMFIG